MCWMTPLALTPGEEAHTRRVGMAGMIFSGSVARWQAHTTPATPAASAGGLGSARAGAQWGWATTTPLGTNGVSPSAPADLSPAYTDAASARLEETIAEAGRLMGRSAEAIWAEAAREWLGRHLGMVVITESDANNDPPPTAPAAMAIMPRRQRRWAEIDSLLADLRSVSAPPTAA